MEDAIFLGCGNFADSSIKKLLKVKKGEPFKTEKEEKEEEGDSHKLQNIPWSCLPLVITLQFQVQVEKNYVENVTKITSELVFNGTEIAGSGVLNYPNYPFEQCSLQIQGI